MLGLLNSLRLTIERYVVGRVSLTAHAHAGDTVLTLATTRRMQRGDSIAVLTKPAANEQSVAEIRTVASVPTLTTIVLDSPLTQSYPAETSAVEKTAFGQFIDGIYVGDPARIPAFPAITIEAAGKTSASLTLQSDRREYEIEIMVYADGGDYDSGYRAMIHYAEQIEQSLFRNVIPLVAPYDLRRLTEDVSASDDLIRLSDPDPAYFGYLPCGATVFFESTSRREPNRIRENVGNDPNVYQLVRPVGVDYSAGDAVIRPLRGFYDSRLTSIEYGTVNKGQALKAARLRFVTVEQVNRAPFVDPWTM